MNYDDFTEKMVKDKAADIRKYLISCIREITIDELLKLGHLNGVYKEIKTDGSHITMFNDHSVLIISSTYKYLNHDAVEDIPLIQFIDFGLIPGDMRTAYKEYWA